MNNKNNDNIDGNINDNNDNINLGGFPPIFFLSDERKKKENLKKEIMKQLI